jgi:exonuclease VII small subunit
MSPTQDNFFGREKELSTLRQLWDQATAKDSNSGPRMAMILAETGYGKTRLIQALYQQLTNDPLWDPAEVNYWPDAFQEVSNQLRVNPDMTKHSPKGPPRFLWAGMRWSPPEERNLEERTCSLPEIRDVLRTHVEISRQHSDVWTKLKAKAGKAIKTDGISEATGQIVDFLGIPFGGLLLKGVKAIGNLATAKSSHSFKEESEKKATDITEELLSDFREIFGAIGSGGVVLPTILFLDDAQWIDPITFKFIGQLWREADLKKWPLFVVITHWERNWRELLKEPENEHESSLAYFKGKKGIHFIELGPSSNNELEGYLKQKLTGLTEEQRKLLLDKSGGNFLTLVENVGFLLQTKMNFENGNVQGKLSKGGENKVKTWEEDRQKRIEQMFAGLSDETKNLLGWSGQLGIRFIKNVVIDFASKKGVEIGLNRLIDECIDPLVILGKASENIREFRHRAFYYVASQHFRDYLSDSESLLKSTLQNHLSQWVNNSFTNEGGLVEIDETDEDQNINAAIFLESSERRDLLEMTVREFMPENGQSKDLNTWVRSVYLLVRVDSEDNLWDLVREKGNLLKEVDWNELFNSVLDLKLRIDLANTLETSGSIRIAKRIRLNVLHHQQLLYGENKSAESLRDVSFSLVSIGGIEQAEGNLDTARTLYAESLEISRKLAEQLNTPESLRDVSISLDRIGDIEKAEGNLDSARTLYSEGLEITRKLAEQLNTPESLRDVSISLERIGDIERAEGNLDCARTLYSEGLEIRRKLAEQLNTPNSLDDVSFSLGRIGDIEVAEGNLDMARTLYSECLEIKRKLAEQLDTPDSLRGVSVSLNKIGNIEKAEGNLDSARTLYSEGLEIARKLAEQLNTPESLRDVYISLDKITNIEQAEGNLDSARTLYSEGLEIARKLAEQLNTPESLRDVSIFLERIGDIEQAEGNLDSASTLYSEGLEISRKLAEQLDTPDSLRGVSVSLDRIGDIEKAEGNLDSARTLYSEGLEIARKLAEQLNTPESLRDVSVSLNKIGNIEQAEGNLDSARTLYSEGLEISRKLAEQLNTPESLRDVSVSLNKIGNIEQAEGNLDSARTLYSEGLEIRRKLAEQLNTPESLRDLLFSLNQIGDIEEAEGNLDMARTLYSECLEISRKLAEQLDTPDSLRDVSVFLEKIGDIEKAIKIKNAKQKYLRFRKGHHE